MVLDEKLEFCCFHKGSSNLPLVTLSHDAFPESNDRGSHHLLFLCLLLRCLENLQKISILYLFNFLCLCGWLQETSIWILEVWLTFTEHDSFFHMSSGLLEWLLNVSTTYCIRVRSCLKTKQWKKFSMICLEKYWRQSVRPSGKKPSPHSNRASPKWQHSENTHSNGAGCNCTCQH